MLKVSIVFCILLFICTSGYTQPIYSLNKRAITQADGLPDRNVNCGLQDKFSYLWFGLRSGLCYYDGIQFTFLTKMSHNLRGSSILALAADDSVGIIIQYIEPGSSSTPSNIIDVINIKTKVVSTFSSYYPQAPFNESDVDKILYTPGEPVQFLLRGNQSFTWTYSRLSGFKKTPLQSTPIQAKLPDIERLTPTQHAQLNARLSSEYILCSDSSLITTSRTNNRLLFVPGKGYLIPFKEPLIKADLLCFLKFDGNLLPLDSAGEKVNKFNDYQGYVWSQNYTANNTYISPHDDTKDAVIEMENHDIIFYSSPTGLTKIFSHEENIKVKSFFKDRLDAWWLCTNVGIYKITLKKKVFTTHFTRKNPGFSLNNSSRGIYTDDEVSCFNLYDAPVIISRGDTIMPKLEQNFAVVRLNDVLWLGQHQAVRFDLTTNKITKIIPSPFSEVWSIFPIQDNSLLLGCSHGMALIDLNKDTVSIIECAPFPTPKFVYKIFRNALGEIMAVAENGIYIFNNNTTVTDFFSITSPRKDRQLPCNGIRDLYQDGEGIYWLGSSQDGLFRWDMKHHDFQHFGIESGFLSNTICGILEDNHNNIWVSTDYGLTRFNKTTQYAITYTKDDGIADNEFNRSSSFKDKTGKLYFGGMNGITSFDPDDLEETLSEKKPDLVINSVIYINSSTGAFEDRTLQVLDQHRITLNEETKSFALRFVLLDYENKQHRYAYKLDGLDNDWHFTNNDEIQLGNLPYNNYRLRIKAQLANGNWSDQEISIAVFVPAPFYKQWWFLTLSALLSVMLITFIISYRTRRLRNRNNQLEQIVSDRTKELQLSLNEQKAMLQEIHHRVKNNLQFIEAIINMQINISREESSQHLLQDINRRINAMTLVHEMLYNKENLEKISVRHYIAELIKKLRGIVDGKQSNFEFNDDIDDIQLNINTCMALGMITTELVSNALKHGVVNSDNPAISIQLKKTNKEKNYFYKIRDNGPGLPEGKIQNGLGMRLIDIFARQLRGSYTFRNDDGLLFTLEMTLVVD